MTIKHFLKLVIPRFKRKMADKQDSVKKLETIRSVDRVKEKQAELKVRMVEAGRATGSKDKERVTILEAQLSALDWVLGK